jgi:hypothetical protein
MHSVARGKVAYTRISTRTSTAGNGIGNGFGNGFGNGIGIDSLKGGIDSGVVLRAMSVENVC